AALAARLPQTTRILWPPPGRSSRYGETTPSRFLLGVRGKAGHISVKFPTLGRANQARMTQKPNGITCLDDGSPHASSGRSLGVRARQRRCDHLRSWRDDDRFRRAAVRVSASRGRVSPVADEPGPILAAHDRGRQQFLRRDQGASLAAPSVGGAVSDFGSRRGLSRLAGGRERLALAVSADALPRSAAVESARVVRIETVIGGLVEREARVVEHVERLALGLCGTWRRGRWLRGTA